MNKKILLIGATGMLGKKVLPELSKDPRFKIYTTSRSVQEGFSNHYPCDLANKKELKTLVDKVAPAFVINCSGITNLKTCEEDHEFADRVHRDATAAIAGAISDECYYVHVSTDSVFDGVKGNYKEVDDPFPLNYYATSKLAGDKAAFEGHKKTLVLRVNIYGGNSPGGNSLLEWGMKSFLSNEKISGFDNVFFNPLYTGQLAKIILFLLHDPRYGILNLGSAGKYSKYQFLLTILNNLKADPGLLTRASYNGEGQTIRRPLDTTLDLSQFSSFYPLPSLEKGITEAMEEYRLSRGL